MNEGYFARELLRWNDEDNDRDFPWKGEKDPYKIWLSEIILQQTRVEQGISYYKKFITRFPDIASLAAASETEIMKLWEGLGYYTRCRNLIATAKYIHTHLHDQFPDDYLSISKLKGVGPYTAAAISSFAFGLPHAVVDGNVKRVLARYFKIETPVDTTAGKKFINNLADRLLGESDPAVFNQAIMDFGAVVCKPANPDCPHCPLNDYCGAYKAGLVQMLPVKQKRIKIKHRFFTYFILRYKNYFYIRRRNKRDIWQNLYEFPLVESGHLLRAEEIARLPALRSHLESGLFSIKTVTGPVVQQLTHQKITAQFIFLTTTRKPDSFLEAGPEKSEQLKNYPFPKILSTLLTEIKTNN